MLCLPQYFGKVRGKGTINYVRTFLMELTSIKDVFVHAYTRISHGRLEFVRSHKRYDFVLKYHLYFSNMFLNMYLYYITIYKRLSSPLEP
jgi:hypothetical protein